MQSAIAIGQGVHRKLETVRGHLTEKRGWARYLTHIRMLLPRPVFCFFAAEACLCIL